jgi:hypothetical protein
VQVRLDRQLTVAVGLAQDRGRRLHEVADAVDVEDEPGGGQSGVAAAEPRDHAATVLGAVAWQMATASASEAWWLPTSTPSTSFTILRSCALSARP